MSSLSIVNIAGYRFVSLSVEQLPQLRIDLKSKALECNLKGTILLSSEGVNAFLAGTRDNVDHFLLFFRAIPEFTDVWFKESFSDYQPFNRMLVRVKKRNYSDSQ